MDNEKILESLKAFWEVYAVWIGVALGAFAIFAPMPTWLFAILLVAAIAIIYVNAEGSE